MNNLQYITEKMGKCWHEWGDFVNDTDNSPITCKKCDKWIIGMRGNPDYSPEFFFEVWNWAIKQDWFGNFIWNYKGNIETELIHPKRFIDAVADYLKKEG